MRSERHTMQVDYWRYIRVDEGRAGDATDATRSRCSASACGERVAVAVGS